MKYGLFLCICGLASLSMAESIHIELGISAEGGLFWVDKIEDPDAYQKAEPEKIKKLFKKARRKAKLYCRQALGSLATIRKIKDWTSLQSTGKRNVIIRHNSSILCIRELNLKSHDPTIGKYLDHARFVLETISHKNSAQDNHQLPANTLKILEQVGAEALPLLWDLHVKQRQSASDSNKFFLTMETIISNNNPAALKKLIAIILESASRSERNLIADKANLLRHAKYPEYLPDIDKAINTAIKEYIEQEAIYCFNHSRYFDAIITLLHGINFWLHDRSMDGSMSTSLERDIRTNISRKLLVLQTYAQHIGSVEEFQSIAKYFTHIFMAP